MRVRKDAQKLNEREKEEKKKVMRFWLREITGPYWCVVSYRLGNIQHSFFCC